MAPHRGGPWELAKDRPATFDRNNLRRPAWCPDHPVMWEDTFNYLKAVELLDEQIGDVLARLERDGLLENSVIVFMGDNGEPLYRSKQFLYDGGLHVPLLIRWPDQRHAGEVDDQLVSGIDLPSMLLGLAGLPADSGMHGRNLLDPACPPRDHIIAARDRMGLGSDRMRAVRTAHYKYIRNFLPGIPYMQLNPYKEESYPPWNLLRELARSGQLTPVEAAFTADRKPFEELYDLSQDPDEVYNLAQDPAHLPALRDLRSKLDHWLDTYPDHGAIMEDPLDVLRVNAATARRIGLTPLE